MRYLNLCYNWTHSAELVQLVERLFSKEKVTGSSPVLRSRTLYHSTFTNVAVSAE